jgi:hypothetical protein
MMGIEMSGNQHLNNRPGRFSSEQFVSLAYSYSRNLFESENNDKISTDSIIASWIHEDTTEDINDINSKQHHSH